MDNADDDANGWDRSAAGWIAAMGAEGDAGRRNILDPAMDARLDGRSFRRALDVGCGEGRFCRHLRARGMAATGIDPTAVLIEHARRADPAGDYRIARAEQLPFADASFDLVLSYLTLIDIPDLQAGLAEMVRVLEPGGTLLIANLTSFCTAGNENGWIRDGAGNRRYFAIDRYLDARPHWLRLNNDIKIRNHHRPLRDYMQPLLAAGLILRHFDEPDPVHGTDQFKDAYRRAPWFHVLEWRK